MDIAIFNILMLKSDDSFINVFFNSQCGRIEGRYYHQLDKKAPAVLILAPDPKYGGDFNNNIIKILENVFIECGFTTLSINYRGVGKSEGVIRESIDAIYDSSFAIDWLKSENKSAICFWVAGYSFGAYVAANIATRRPEIENFILLSPIIKNYDFSFAHPALCNGAIIIGEKDNFTNISDIDSELKKMNEVNYEIVKFIPIGEADHLYKGKEEELISSLRNYINITVATRIIKPVKKKRRKRTKKEER